MQRPIKFRGFHKERKVMCHFDIKTITRTPYPGFYYTEDLDGFYCEQDDPNLYTDLMQYTGLKDKKGIEIYEGDVVIDFTDISDGKRKWQITWETCGFEMQTEYLMRILRVGDDLEVVGNIYENKELLNDN